MYVTRSIVMIKLTMIMIMIIAVTPITVDRSASFGGSLVKTVSLAAEKRNHAR